MFLRPIFVCLGVYLVVGVLGAQAETKNSKSNAPTGTKATANTLLTHELWGQTIYGDGYVYGPRNRRSGMTPVDLDGDSDTDFIFPSSINDPEWMVNLGSAEAFYPGGAKELDVDKIIPNAQYDIGLEFGDLDGDSLPDMLAVFAVSDPFVKQVAWFKNLGPRDKPRFKYQGILYTSPQTDFWDGVFVSLADLDNDQDLDLYVVEAFSRTAERSHRIFYCQNTGNAQSPSFAPPQELTELSNLLPPRVPLKKELAAAAKAHEQQPALAKLLPGKDTGFFYNVSDIGFFDWDLDGDLDFMFYDRTDGLFWVENLGTSDAPQWANTLGNGGKPIYSHQDIDNIDISSGTFSIHQNPNRARPGAEWLDEMYLSVANRLKIFRYYAGSGYRLISQNAVAFLFDRGPAAFWDFDGDGDLDMFKSTDPDTPEAELKLIRNRGTVYAPAWDDSYVSIPGVSLNGGTLDNHFREDQFVFGPYYSPVADTLYIQRQNGTIDLAEPTGSLSDGAPTFTVHPNEYEFVVDPTHHLVAPAGIAAADFDGDGVGEIITVYQHTENDTVYGELAVVDQDPVGPTYTYTINDFLTDADGSPLDPSYIESLSAGDLDGDGRPDLLVTTATDLDYKKCETFAYRNITFQAEDGTLYYEFRNVGRLDTVFNTDNRYARMTSLADIDGDSDLDLFVGHRYPDGDNSNLYSYVRFYRNGSPTGLRYTRFRMTANSLKPLTLPIIFGSQVQYVAPQYDLIQNTSGGSLSYPNAVWHAGSFAPSVDILQSTDLRANYGTQVEMRSFVDVLPAVGANESKAILIVGDAADDDLYTTFRDLAAFAHTVLIDAGLPKSNIRLYAATNFDVDNDGVNDVTGTPQAGALQDAVTSWGATPNKLLVYMVGHGQRGRFRLSETDFLEATTYDGWLDQIQTGGRGPLVTTVIDACESGSFLPILAGPRRINLSGADVGPTGGVALFDKSQYVSFSLSFWGWLYYGNSYGSSFRYAKNAIQSLNPLQKPQIDDTGNGQGNEENDGIIADENRPGADFEVNTPSVFISDIAPAQSITSKSTTLWLSGVIAPFPVDSAKAIIVPPNFKRPSGNNDDEQPVTNLPVVFFNYNANLNRWEGTFNDFNEGGIYQVQYFVTVGGQVYASPHIGFVDRVNAPDAWEADDSAPTSKWLPINTVAGHNFHKAGDQDWIRFSVPAGSATIAILNTRQACQADLALYRATDLLDDLGAAPIAEFTAEEPGKELTAEHIFTGAGQYLLRVRNATPSVFGEGTSYQVLVAVDTGGGSIIPSTCVISVLDENNAPIDGANVTFAGDNIGRTDGTGIAQAVVTEYGNYTATAIKDGYQQASQLVVVNNLLETTSLKLKVDGTPPTPPSCACTGNGTPRDYAGDALLVLVMMGIVLLTGRRRHTTSQVQAVYLEERERG